MNDWRMHTLFAKDHSVIVISLARHDKGHNPHQVLADVFPGLSPVGRRKRAKPPCCDDPEGPPVMPALSEQLAGMFGYT
ncbi:MAG TPA: hypothetical protein VID48_01345 [Solirubrobacteraceae bacterium]